MTRFRTIFPAPVTMRGVMLMLALLLFAGTANAQTAPPPDQQSFNLPPGAVIMWKLQPNMPMPSTLPGPPADVDVPDGWTGFETSEKMLFKVGPGGLELDPRMLVCYDAGLEYSAGSKNSRGQTCECPTALAWGVGCSWKD